MEKVGVVDEDGVVEGGVRMPFVGLAYNELGFLSSCCEHLSFDLRHLAPVVAVVVDQVPKSLPRGLDAPRVGDQVVAIVSSLRDIRRSMRPWLYTTRSISFSQTRSLTKRDCNSES